MAWSHILHIGVRAGPALSESSAYYDLSTFATFAEMRSDLRFRPSAHVCAGPADSNPLTCVNALGGDLGTSQARCVVTFGAETCSDLRFLGHIGGSSVVVNTPKGWEGRRRRSRGVSADPHASQLPPRRMGWAGLGWERTEKEKENAK